MPNIKKIMIASIALVVAINGVGQVVSTKNIEINDIGVMSDVSAATTEGNFTAVKQKYLDGNEYYHISGYTGTDAKVNIPSEINGVKVTGINDNAFKAATIKEINIPSTISNISVGAFTNCTNLNSINVDSKNIIFASDNGILFTKRKNTMVKLPQSYKGVYKVPAEVNTIDSYCFANCSNLTGIVFTSTIKTISTGSFMGCKSITSISFPDGTERIMSKSFKGCTSLTKLYLPKSIVNIEQNVFEDIEGKITMYCVPGSYADTFSKNLKIKTTEVSEGYTIKDDSSTNTSGETNTSGKTDITNPSSVITPASSFTYKKSKTINGISYIEITGYTGSEENVVIPDTIEGTKVLVISKGVFADNTKIKNITLPSGVSDIGAYPFKGCSNLKSISISASNDTYATKDGVLFNKKMTELLNVPGGLEGTYQVPTGVTYLQNYSFYECSKLKNIIISSTVRTIGIYVFANCSSLTNINIVEGITQLQSGEFNGCTNLTEIYIPESVKNIDGNCLYSSGINVIICCIANSEAEKFAIKNKIPYKNVSKGYVTVNEIPASTTNKDTDKINGGTNTAKSGDMSSGILPVMMMLGTVGAYKLRKRQ